MLDLIRGSLERGLYQPPFVQPAVRETSDCVPQLPDLFLCLPSHLQTLTDYDQTATSTILPEPLLDVVVYRRSGLNFTAEYNRTIADRLGLEGVQKLTMCACERLPTYLGQSSIRTIRWPTGFGRCLTRRQPQRDGSRSGWPFCSC